MKNKLYILLKLTLIYFSLSVIFLLLFPFSIAIAIFSLFPTGIKAFLISIFRDLSSLELIKNPPYFLRPFFIFILMELPFVSLGLLVSYLVLRKRHEKKYHLLAIIFSLVGLLILSSYTVIKPITTGRRKLPGFFSIQLSLKEIRCNNLPKQTIFNWTYPINGQTNVPTHSPVVVNLKDGLRISSSCDATYTNGRHAQSSKMIGGFSQNNIPLVPDGKNPTSDISELNYLSKASIDEIKNFNSLGKWDSNTTIKVTCNYIKLGCSGSESFSFTTGNE